MEFHTWLVACRGAGRSSTATHKPPDTVKLMAKLLSVTKIPIRYVIIKSGVHLPVSSKQPAMGVLVRAGGCCINPVTAVDL